MKITSTKQLSSFFKDARKRKDISQSTVAKKIGIKQDTVSKFELDADGTRLDTFFKILSALNLELQIKERDSDTTDNSWKEEW